MVSLLYSLISTKVYIHKSLFSVNANMLQTKMPAMLVLLFLFVYMHTELYRYSLVIIILDYRQKQ